jgi:membrane protease subunit HflK
MAPGITRKRLYLETMESVLSRNKKVFLDVDSNGNILYLPLDGAVGESPATRIVPPVTGQNSTGSNGLERSNPRSTARESRQ